MELFKWQIGSEFTAEKEICIYVEWSGHIIIWKQISTSADDVLAFWHRNTSRLAIEMKHWQKPEVWRAAQMFKYKYMNNFFAFMCDKAWYNERALET